MAKGKQEKETKGTEKVTKGKETKGTEKQAKRELTWKERGSGNPLTKEGKTWELTKESMEERLSKDGKTMAAWWPLATPGYHFLETENGREWAKGRDKLTSNFSKVTGIGIGNFRKMEVNKEKGILLGISVGGYKNHYQFILPREGKEIQALKVNGQTTIITKENFMDINHLNILTNHGRAYRGGDLLAWELGIYHTNPGKGNYYHSTPTSLQFFKKGSEWYLFTTSGRDRKAPHPWEILEMAKTLDYNSFLEFLELFSNGKDITKYWEKDKTTKK